MIEFLAGALVLAYASAGLHFLSFWRRTGDRLFLHFAIAFWLLALNQIASSIPSLRDEASGYEYLLRVVGFVLILIAIIDKDFTATIEAITSRPKQAHSGHSADAG